MQKEYKTRHEWMGKVIHWELCKKFKFDHTNKWYMHNLESVLENEMHKLLWDIDIQTDHRFSTRRPDLMMVNKENRICRIVDSAVPADHRVKNDKHQDLASELIKTMNMKVTVIPIVVGVLGAVTKGLKWGLEDLEIRGRRGNHPSYSIAEID